MVLKGILSACWRGGSTYLAYLIHKNHPEALTLSELFFTDFTRMFVECEYANHKGRFGTNPPWERIAKLIFPYRLSNGEKHWFWKMTRRTAGAYVPNRSYHQEVQDQYRTKEFKKLWQDGLRERVENYEKASAKLGYYELVDPSLYPQVKDVLKFIDEHPQPVYLQVNRLHLVLDKVKKDFDVPMVHVVRNVEDVYISSVVKVSDKLSHRLPFNRYRCFSWYEYEKMALKHGAKLPQKQPERGMEAYKWINDQIKTVEKHPYENIDWDAPNMKQLIKDHTGFVVMRNKLNASP